MLLARDPKPPKTDNSFGVTVGGKDEAWQYRERHYALWQSGGSLDWLAAAWRSVKVG